MTFNPDGPNAHVADDPFASATNATLRPREYWGQLSVDAWFCKLVKGQGKVPWDKTSDPVDNRATALTVELQPLAESNLNFALKREMIAESPEWVKIVWPSLRACGVQAAKQANGLWVKLIQEPTGRTYRSNKDGTEHEATTFKILEVYPNEAACVAAYRAVNGEPETNVVEEITGIDFGGNGHQAQAQQATMPGTEDTRKRDTAKAFLLAIAKQKQGDLDAIKGAVAAMPLIIEFYDLDSPEFMAVVAEAL